MSAQSRHLTLTGSMAGQTLCGGERTGNDWHATYAPLHLATHRAEVCQTCLNIYLDSFDADEMLPAWAAEVQS